MTSETTTETRKNLSSDAKGLIADARNDITIPFFNETLQPADDTLIERGGGLGLKIYDQIERDTHAYAVLQKRKRLLLARDWDVDAASDKPRDIEAADFVRQTLQKLQFDDICEGLLDATLKGFAVSEIVWKRDGNRIIPERIVSHDQRRFVFGEDWQPRLLTWQNMSKGIELPQRKFIVHRFGVKGNNPYGLGLGSRLFWAVLFKREGVAFWLHYLDKFAGPTIVGKTPLGSLPAEQRKLLNTLTRMRTSAASVVPMDTDVSFLEAARSGSVSYGEWLAYWDKQITICINGETLTTDIGANGSRAASETHADILSLLVGSDGDMLSGTLKSQLAQWLIDYNFPGAGVPDIWRVKPEDEKQAAETRKSKADAASASDKALVAVLRTAGMIDDDEAAREMIVGSGIVDHLTETAIERLVEARFAFMEGGKRGRDLRQAVEESPMFAQLFGDRSKKN
ncbi:phage portal protein family protein [Martelella mediterranea]|uniref:Uncharacterized protein DUF935 n=1 Tax=Martelella mediterranea TaxID=293089 RepID=A0A4V2V453_9HYPH|nr:DUF935 family protein [Martelella mediterranea]TCT37438.1 uncharacterized protein DUF935 [Martelella mediterranea]